MSRLGVTATAALLAVALTACAPTQVSSPGATADLSDGTLRVWLFSEVAQDPKSAVVDAAVAEFEQSHEGVSVEVQYIPVDSRAERFTAAFNDPSSAPTSPRSGTPTSPPTWPTGGCGT